MAAVFVCRMEATIGMQEVFGRGLWKPAVAYDTATTINEISTDLHRMNAFRTTSLRLNHLATGSSRELKCATMCV